MKRIFTKSVGTQINPYRSAITGYPLHRENRKNRENGQNKSLSGKTQGIWKFCQNTRKTIQGKIVNSLILKVKDISKFAAKISQKKLKLDKSAKAVLCM